MLFNLYSGVAGTQLLGWLCVFIGLIVLNEIGRRTKVGGIAVFMVIPAILTVYFILAYCGLFGGKENLTVKYMSGWWGIYSSKNKRQDMLWPDMTCWFILAYDVWNFEYTYCIWKRWNKLSFGYVQHSYGTLPVWNSLRSCCRRCYCQHGNYS